MTARRVRRPCRAGGAQREGERRQLQHSLLPAEPARRRSSSRDGGLGEVRLVTGRYFQDWLLLDTDWNWRLEPDRGGALRAVGDIGSHWLDLVAFITGQRITSVMADLATFIPTRRQPSGPVETFSTERDGKTLDREIATEDVATILLRFENGARGIGRDQPAQPRAQELAAVRGRRLAGGRVLGLRAAGPAVDRPSRSTQRDPHPQPGTDGPRRAGRRLAAGRARRGIRGHVQGALPRHLRRRRGRARRPIDRATRPSPTATTRCS